jgi:redox-sensing transcriptional repressor
MKDKLKSTEEIPDIVIGRLPIYIRALTRMAEDGEKITTSSLELGQWLGISSAQIRKDLSHFGEFGKQGTGYHINYLIGQLRQILHLEEDWPVVLIGAGFIGHALAHYPGFQHRGFSIRWIFDNDPEKIDRDMNGMMVQDVSQLTPVIQRENITMAVLAIPASAAQEMADLLVEAGIKAILSYAPISLTVPPNILVQYSDPVVQLQHMTYYLKPKSD